MTFAGQIIECKGVADLLHAWRALDSRVRGGVNSSWSARIFRAAGVPGPDAGALDELDCPAFVGFRDDVGEWLLASDLAVVPSHVEPLGNATLEAMRTACL